MAVPKVEEGLCWLTFFTFPPLRKMLYVILLKCDISASVICRVTLPLLSEVSPVSTDSSSANFSHDINVKAKIVRVKKGFSHVAKIMLFSLLTKINSFFSFKTFEMIIFAGKI